MRSFLRPAVRVAAFITVAVVASATTHRLGAQAPVAFTNSFASTSASTSSSAADSAVAPIVIPTVVAIDSMSMTAPELSTPTAAVAGGAPVAGLRAAVHNRETARSLTPTTIQAGKRAGLGQAQALMIVGAAALVAGAIIGDDPGTIIMVGGAVIGLYGLYQYLQ